MRKLKITEMNRLTVDEFKQAAKLPLVVVLDDVRSLHNVGAVFRTSDAFRVERVCLCGITAVPPQPEIHKTALGAEDSVDWTYYKDAADAVRELQGEGYTVYAVEQAEGSTMLQHFRGVGQRGEGRPSGRGGPLRRLPGDSPIRHQTFAQCLRDRRHRHLGNGQETRFE